MAESSARRPGLLRRLFLCSTGSCPFRPGGDYIALWGECTICGRRTGEVSREFVRRYAEMEERDRRISAGLPPACVAAPSIDTLDPDGERLAISSATPAMREIVRVGEEMMHPAFVEPVTAYMVRDGFERLRADPRLGAGAVFTSRDVLRPDEARVEVEIRLRRVIPEGEA